MKNIKYLIIAIVFLGIGFFLASLWLGTKKEFAGFSKEKLNELETDSLRKVQQAADSVLRLKERALFDSLKQVARLRDSILLVKGKLTSTQLTLPRNGAAYKMIDSLSLSLDSLIYTADEALMKRIVDILKPTNQAFKSLVKSIKEKKERLEKIAGTYATVADAIGVLVNILSSPILAPAAATPDVSHITVSHTITDV